MAKKEVVVCDLCDDVLEGQIIEYIDGTNFANVIPVTSAEKLLFLDLCSNCYDIIKNLIQKYPDYIDYRYGVNANG